MPRNRIPPLLAALLLAGLAACGGGEGEAGASPDAGAPPVTDAPPPAYSDPASPSPVGTDVGAAQNDATAAPAAGDTSATRGANP